VATVHWYDSFGRLAAALRVHRAGQPNEVLDGPQPVWQPVATIHICIA